ncbi:MAG: zinc metallopeptidase [Raoultibacter sp.]
MGISGSYLALIAATLLIGFGAQFYVNSQLKKYSSVPISSGITGAEAARRMLAFHNVSGVTIQQGGPGQDFFDPRTNSITLDPDAYSGTSITATATACHEVGHACQYAKGYAPMKIRSAIVPVVNIASNAWVFILMIGIFMNIAGLTTLAVIMYAAVVAFQLVTLPVEFDASRRAMAYVGTTGISQAEQGGAFSVLRACAFTYVAAALTSILQLLYLLSQRRD